MFFLLCRKICTWCCRVVCPPQCGLCVESHAPNDYVDFGLKSLFIFRVIVLLARALLVYYIQGSQNELQHTEVYTLAEESCNASINVLLL